MINFEKPAVTVDDDVRGGDNNGTTVRGTLEQMELNSEHLVVDHAVVVHQVGPSVFALALLLMGFFLWDNYMERSMYHAQVTKAQQLMESINGRVLPRFNAYPSR